MAESWTPVITAASMTPNPAVAGQNVLLSVAAADIQSVEQTEARVSGEFVSGEV